MNPSSTWCGFLGAERLLDLLEQAGAAAGHLHGGHGVVDDAAGDRAERVGGGAFAGGRDGLARVAGGSDAWLEGDLPEQLDADLVGERLAAARSEQARRSPRGRT